MFTVIDNTDVILPQYPCGNRGPSVSANLHGEKWAVWTLLDNLDKHVGKPHNAHQKPKCQRCYDALYTDRAESEKAFKEFLDAAAADMKATEEIYAASKDVVLTAAQMFAALELMISVEPAEPITSGWS